MVVATKKAEVLRKKEWNRHNECKAISHCTDQEYRNQMIEEENDHFHNPVGYILVRFHHKQVFQKGTIPTGFIPNG